MRKRLLFKYQPCVYCHQSVQGAGVKSLYALLPKTAAKPAAKKAEPKAPEKKPEPVKAMPEEKKPEAETAAEAEAPRPEEVEIPDIPYDLMTVEQLQAVILRKMAQNGPVTERMRQDVIENIWHNSLVNWANSFR